MFPPRGFLTHADVTHQQKRCERVSVTQRAHHKNLPLGTYHTLLLPPRNPGLPRACGSGEATFSCSLGASVCTAHSPPPPRSQPSLQRKEGIYTTKNHLQHLGGVVLSKPEILGLSLVFSNAIFAFSSLFSPECHLL